MNILYEDTALVVLDKPAGLTSEEGVPAALRQRWGRPDAYVGVIHRLDTGVSGLMVYARTPGAAAALTKQVTESQQAYAILDGRVEAGPGAPAQPCFLKTYRAVIAGGPDEQLPPEGILRDYLFKDSRKGGHIRSGCSLPPGSTRFTETANMAADSKGTLPCRAQGCALCTRIPANPWPFLCPCPPPHRGRSFWNKAVAHGQHLRPLRHLR